MKTDSDSLANYPNIAALGIDARSLAALKSSNDEFSLQDILERKTEPDWQRFLTGLDANISIAGSILSKKKMRDKLLANPFSSCWEFEVAAYLISKHITTYAEPKTTGNSNTDFLVKLCGTDVFVEAHARRLKEKEEQRYGSADITMYLKETMLKKIRQNAIPKDFPHPLILAIDGEYAAMDRIAVEISFDQFGSDVSQISTILLKHNGYHLIANPRASKPLSKEQIGTIL